MKRAPAFVVPAKVRQSALKMLHAGAGRWGVKRQRPPGTVSWNAGAFSGNQPGSGR
jgi:hypothetical protein